MIIVNSDKKDCGSKLKTPKDSLLQKEHIKMLVHESKIPKSKIIRQIEKGKSN